MDSASQVVFVLQLILALGPLAVYFLGLGLVNSQAHPSLINARADFVLLATAFVPVIVGPAVLLVQQGHAWIALGVVLAVGGVFLAMLPRRDAGWVIYNISPAQCRRILEQACRRLGWGAARVDENVLISPVGLMVSQTALPWLRNVTIRIRPTGQVAGTSSRGLAEPARRELLAALHEEMQREAMLPSPTGASLVVIGAALLGVPMWYVFHHMDAIVDVVRHMLFA